MDFVAFPEWTEYRKKNGLDPLGMQTSSISFYQWLLPGIGNVTLRVRYYGLYSWLTSQYSQRIGNTDPLEWQRILRRAEALYALTAAQADNESGVAGITWAQKTLEGNKGEVIDFAHDAEPGSETHYLKQAWGAYGAAYGGQLFEIGLLTDSNEHEIPIPQRGYGDKLATAFERAGGHIASKFFESVQEGKVELDDLNEFNVLLPSNIEQVGAEREIYEEVLFARVENPTEKDLNRRLTLGLILKSAEHLRRRPTADDVRWLAYAGCSINGKRLQIDSKLLANHVTHWWAYQANDLIHFVFETFLKYLLDLLEGYPQGVSLHSLVDEGVSRLQAEISPAPADWSEFLELCTPTENAASDEELSEKSISIEILQGSKPNGVCTAATASKALYLLAVLHNRYQINKEKLKESLSFIRPEPFRSMKSELGFLGSVGDKGFQLVLHDLLLERTVRRHLWVATNKLRYQGDYTHLFETDDGLVRLRGKSGPVFTNPRIGSALTFLEDIALIDDNGLTHQGSAVLSGL
jgi:hypothetical protein